MVAQRYLGEIRNAYFYLVICFPTDIFLNIISDSKHRFNWKFSSIFCKPRILLPWMMPKQGLEFQWAINLILFVHLLQPHWEKGSGVVSHLCSLVRSSIFKADLFSRIVRLLSLFLAGGVFQLTWLVVLCFTWYARALVPTLLIEGQGQPTPKHRVKTPKSWVTVHVKHYLTLGPWESQLWNEGAEWWDVFFIFEFQCLQLR